MKKFVSLITAVVLCLLVCNVSAQTEADAFFHCRVGNISFALPGYPQVFQEVDLPAKETESSYLAWQNKYQLTGFGPDEGEFQIHIADLTPVIEWMQEERPGEEMYQYQANAVMNLVQFYLDIHDGSLEGEADLAGTNMGDKTILQISFAYAYPDADGVPYRGKAYMDGNQAVVMMVLADEANLVYLNDMGPISNEEVAALPASVAETVTVGRVQFTFPETPLKEEQQGYWLYQAFTEDYGYLSVEHMTADFSFMLEEGMTMDELLPTLTEVTAQQYQAQGIIGEYEVKKLAEGLYAFEAMEKDERYPEGHGPKGTYVMGIFSTEGVYTVSAVDTEMGRAAYDSLVIVDREK